MRAVRLERETDFEGWRGASRALLAHGVPPDEIAWSVAGAGDLFAADAALPPVEVKGSATAVPRSFVEMAQTVILHRDPQRFACLYELLWRLRNEPRLMDLAVDPGVARLETMAKSVGRDVHKMRAFVRFRRTKIGESDWYVAWFEPEHHIVEANAPFFMRRFTTMNWSILTPEASAHWDGANLVLGPGGQRADAPSDDALEDLWRGYYASIFNPARLKVQAMRTEMPVKYWRNLPEAPLIRPLIEDAQRRTDAMVAEGPTEPKARPQRARLPERSEPPAEGTLDALRREAAGCRACPLWEPATQTVFGEGRPDAPVMFVGEQPGDQEDLQGRPFVGPAGRLFDGALAEAGIERSRVYLTNAVKHFKFEPRGKRRIHRNPGAGEIQACRFWLEKEVALVRPRLIVAMGASAARAVLGRVTPVGASRGRLIERGEGVAPALVTVHPSYLLRLPDEAAKADEYARFIAELRLSRPFVALRDAG